ncbi:SigE family RNA polymerase sigma factor [Amycolatopsis sp.]|uniref:SigE family RNA polymerase sigma factor n=1 Tax=Amycolatopsis sp. TaxID=37632 RepID=UPI002BEF3386|nr:SigE family RNA polymerase sigma factor [Amycolatopsis sp.]HVV12022.1 SigE family RNA polymerase sigma factor [Amycolatopsis sp.]
MVEPRGFEEYVQGRQDLLVRAAYLITGDSHLAQDLVQIALERVWQRWERVRHVENLDGYVYRVLMRAYLGIRRRRWATERPTADLQGAGTAQGDQDVTLDRLTLMDALARLPPRQRATVVLRFYLDLSERQTAEALGCAVGTVKSQTAKGLSTLRAVMDVLGEGSPSC